MSLLSLEAILIYISMFFASIVSGAFGMGGGILLLALMTLFIPLNILIPLHGVLNLANTSTRSFIYRANIKWRIVALCTFGTALGAILGVMLNLNLPENIFSILLGLILVSVVWAPKNVSFQLPLVPSGFIHGFVSASFGTGGVLQAMFSRIKLSKTEVIATFSTIMLGLGLAKTVSFGVAGVPVLDFVPVMFICVIPAFIGASIGKKLNGLLSEEQFKLIFRYLVTGLGLRLIISGFLSV